MSNRFDFCSNGRVVYKGTQFTEYEEIEEVEEEEDKFDGSSLWAQVEGAIPLFLVGMVSAIVEDNGFTPPKYESRWDSNWFIAGKILGHACALAQATAEIVEGVGSVILGGGLAAFSAPTGGLAGLASASLVTVGAMESAHGSLVLGNSAKNVLNESLFFTKRGNGGSSSKTKFNRSMSERRKALLRDADDPNSGLSQEARDFIKKNNGYKVPEGYEVSHETPLYTEKTVEGKKKLDVEKNMKTIEKPTHRGRHKPCGDQFHDFPR